MPGEDWRWHLVRVSPRPRPCPAPSLPVPGPTRQNDATQKVAAWLSVEIWEVEQSDTAGAAQGSDQGRAGEMGATVKLTSEDFIDLHNILHWLKPVTT